MSAAVLAPASATRSVTASAAVASSPEPLAPINDDGLGMTVVRLPVLELGGLVQVRVGERLLTRGAWSMPLPQAAIALLREQGVRPTALLPERRPLPDWLHFDPDTMTLTAVDADRWNTVPQYVVLRAGDARLLVSIQSQQAFPQHRDHR
jgi:hypothetical protein